MRALAINSGPDFHLLDHIAPLAEFLQIPLATTEEKNFALASQYYPSTTTTFMPNLEFQLNTIAKNYDLLFECKYWKPHLKLIFRQMYGKEMKLIFCPHGQSDKGLYFPTLAPYATQDAVFIYGPLMLKMLFSLNIPLSNYVICGNYRLKHYQKHKKFHDASFEKQICLDPQKRTLLYAPTWKDADETTLFFEWGEKIISEIPSDWNLVIKPHPLLELRNPIEYYRTSKLIDRFSNAFLLEDFPLVYPVLAKADCYLGDFSSVGYDFLWFQKPMFFLPSEKTSRLYTCGTTLEREKNIYSQLDASQDFAQKQRALYHQAFATSNFSLEAFTQLVEG